MADKETTDGLQKKIVRLTNLPKSVQGDGRYLMSLLRQSLEEIALQVNLANGFSAEEINPTEGSYPTPRNFYLSFTRLGGVLSWSKIADESNLAFYETRTDTNVGSSYNLLDRTTDNSSMKLPVSYSDTIYLYAVSKDNVASNYTEINYTKARPDAPTDIALTATNNGTLITFMEIPTDCIGATIYIDGVAYTSADNIFLLTQETTSIEKVEIAYFDQFGEGEHGVLYITLPDVTSFLVERNGSELDFYWDAVNIYGVSYVVKVGREADWAKGVELFTTKTNDKNRYIYPNTGEYYLMVKAVDEHGNYSKNAAFYLITNDQDIYRNVILEFNQADTLYSGNKINIYYNATFGGITLERENTNGEYIFEVNLPQEYKARNWLEYNPILSSDSDVTWDDLEVAWDDLEHLAWGGLLGDLESVVFKQQISYPKDSDKDMLLNATLNDVLTTTAGDSPSESRHADEFKRGRWADGLYISQLTRLSYSVGTLPSEFNFSFCMKTEGEINDMIIAVLQDDDGNRVEIGYEAYDNKYYAHYSDGNNLYVGNTGNTNREWLTFAISQSETERALYIHFYNKNEIKSAKVDAEPMSFGASTTLYCYPTNNK